MILKIRYKTIKEERCEDAPFVGALICAIDCKFNCKNCFNQDLKALVTIEDDSINIIKKIKENPFNKGIILAGLEWSYQPKEAINLSKVAKKNNLRTMLYTGLNFEDKKVKYILKCGDFDYIKCGLFLENSNSHEEYGIILASENQHIYKKGKDY